MPLHLSKDYEAYNKLTPIWDGKKIVHHVVKTPTKEYNLSTEVNRKLYRKTKLNRLIRLLGKGDMSIGLTKLDHITKQLTQQYISMYQDLETQVAGKKVLEYYMGEHVSYLNVKLRELEKYGITTYRKVHSIHHILKMYQKLQNTNTSRGEYIPIEKRLPITPSFLKKYYWDRKLTTYMIADAIYTPEIYVQNAVRTLGMQKRENGIELRGRKGYKMPEHEKVKHRNQPHARAVVRICPREFKVLAAYNSTGAVERDGWSRENVRKAIRTVGLHDGFLWAYKGDEQSIIQKAKDKGNLEKKLAIFDNGIIPRDKVKELYIDQGMNYQQVANELNCNWHTIACIASKMGLKKRNPIDDATLKRLYIDQGLQAKQIAVITGHSVKTISTYLSKRGIRKRATA